MNHPIENFSMLGSGRSSVTFSFKGAGSDQNEKKDIEREC